jgi:hypothetical protein
MKWMCLLLWLACAAPAAGQETIALYFDDPANGLQRWGYTYGGAAFEIVAVVETDSSMASVEFVMTELAVEFPGLFKLATTKLANTPLDAGANGLGEYAMEFTGCVEAGVHEVVRVMYGDFAGVLIWDVIVNLRGFESGDTLPSGFGGRPGYVDCTDGAHDLTLAPWEGLDDCTFPPGSLALNMTMVLRGWGCGVENEHASFTALKFRY